MEKFRNLTLDEIGARYKNNQILLVQHLMEAGLIQKIPPECHGVMVLDKSKPWLWRCPTRCGKRKSVVTENCFLNKCRKFYDVFKALYMWVLGFPPRFIVRESGLSQNTVTALNNDWREIAELENRMEPSIGGDKSTVQADETFITGTRKDNKGKRQRKEGILFHENCNNSKKSLHIGPVLVQTALKITPDENGKLRAGRLKAAIIPDRSGCTLQENLINMVEPDTAVQTDCWRGYCGLDGLFSAHATVNHSREFVSDDGTTTNTLEGVHGVMKRTSSRLNLFVGQPSKLAALKRKVEELVFRFNHRDEDSDFFVLFLHLISVYYPCCSDDDVVGRLELLKIW